MFCARGLAKKILATCLESKQRFVADNTNPTQADRAVYIQAAKARKFTIACYYFSSRIEDAIARNALRSGKARVPDVAIRGTLDKLEYPSLSEGFDALYHVAIVDGEFIVSEWMRTVGASHEQCNEGATDSGGHHHGVSGWNRTGNYLQVIWR